MKQILLLLALCLTFGATMAQQTAQQAAQQAALRASGAKSLQPLSVALDLHHIYCFTADDGRTLFATADSRQPLLGYSTETLLPGESLPPALAAWLGEMDLQLQRGETEPSARDLRKTLPDSVAPLLHDTWSQYGQGYNSLCPEDSLLDLYPATQRLGGHPTVGCVALSMGQVMRYWGYPLHGLGSRSYSYEGQAECWHYGTLSANFGEATYQFSLMPDRLTDSSTDAERHEVAQLLYHCGVAAYMNYNADCQGSSGSHSQYQLDGLVHHFGYNSDAHLEERYNYNASSWSQLLRTELAEGRPVLMAAYSYGGYDDSIQDGGHAFVIDGYDAQGLVHVNWGWGGSCNGYYDLATLRPLPQYAFAYSQMALIGVDTNQGVQPVLRLAEDLQMERDTVFSDGYIRAHYAVTNTGVSPYDGYVGTAVYGTTSGNFHGYADGEQVHIESGDTLRFTIHQRMQLNPGRYQLVMQHSTEAFSPETQVDMTNYFSDPEHNNRADFRVVQGSETAILQPLAQQPILTPNPASDKLLLSALPESCTVSLLDLQGRLLLQRQAHGQLTLQLAQLPRGLYLLQVVSPEGQSLHKLLLQ